MSLVHSAFASATLLLLVSEGVRGQSYSLGGTVSYALPGTSLSYVDFRGGAGDWSGDGTPDFAVVSWSGFSTPPGRLRIYSGFDYALAQEWIGSVYAYPPSVPLIGEIPGYGLGFADLDGDGYPEALIGTRESFLGGIPFVGKVDAVSAVSGLTLYTIWGQSAGDAFGGAITVVGDTSGNGVPDFLVYADGADGPAAFNLGAIYLIEGFDGSIRQTFLAPWPCAYCGPTMGEVGDVDGDGLADFALAIPGWNAGAGKVTIYSGLSPGTVVREHFGTQPGWWYGAGTIFLAGDADADAVGDYVIADWVWGGGTVGSPGQGWLHSGATGNLITTYVPPPGTTGLGFYGDDLDDLDGDGVNDLVFSAGTLFTTGGYTSGGQVVVVSGLSGATLQVIDSPSIGIPPGGTFQQFGREISNIGDIDGDGRSDFACGRTPGPLFVFVHDIVTVAANPVPLGSNATFSFSVPAQPGAQFHLLLSLSSDVGIPIGTRVFPLDLDGILVQTLLNPYLGGLLDSTGNATVSIPVPVNPALSGLSFEFAGLTLSPTAPFGVTTIGAAGTVTIQ
ncbi:MAG: hypothetical protein L0323_15935 [Planctomycetes bacterium]|nr:hypothetical protein [Planctomycetota bacterium]